MLRLIFIFLLILAHSVSYGKKYTLSETPNGLCLKQWLGKDSVIDFNSHKELKKVKIIGEMAFEKNNHIKKVILPAQLKIIEKRAFVFKCLLLFTKVILTVVECRRINIGS